MSAFILNIGDNMKKRVVKRKFKKLKFTIFLLTFIGTFVISIRILNHIHFKVDSKDFLRLVLENSNPYMEKVNKKSLSYQLVKYVLSVDLKNPATIFKSTYRGSVSTASDEIEPAVGSSYIEDPYPEKDPPQEPLVYIYNTHQLEKYSTANIEEYEVVPNVMMASYILREKLYDNGIGAIVENADVNEFLQTNNWNYASSYKVTKLLMEDAKSKNPTLNYFIDLHRDSVKKSISTAEINGRNYAKILFIVGLENPAYQENLKTTERVRNLLEEKYPGITRSIYQKQGPGVNGIYNQDFHPNTILVEMGGEENTIDEVLNSTLALSDVLTTIIREDGEV